MLWYLAVPGVNSPLVSGPCARWWWAPHTPTSIDDGLNSTYQAFMISIIQTPRNSLFIKKIEWDLRVGPKCGLYLTFSFLSLLKLFVNCLSIKRHGRFWPSPFGNSQKMHAQSWCAFFQVLNTELVYIFEEHTTILAHSWCELVCPPALISHSRTSGLQ